MKQAIYTKNEIIKKIKEKKELSGIADSIIEEALANYAKKHFLSLENVKNHQSQTGGMDMPHSAWFLSTPKIPRAIQTTSHRRVESWCLNNSQAKIIIKEIRAQLRYFVGQYQKSKKPKKKSSSEYFKDLLRTHSSTAERIEFYPRIKRMLSSLKINSILDLGCGLNPIALASPKIRYFASDINENELSIIKEFFIKKKIQGETFVYDLRKIEDNLPKADLALLFKVLDIISTDKKIRSALVEKIITKLPCRYLLISFSTKKLSGSSMNFPKRIWFERILQKLKLNFKTFSAKNEIFYQIEKSSPEL